MSFTSLEDITNEIIEKDYKFTTEDLQPSIDNDLIIEEEDMEGNLTNESLLIKFDKMEIEDVFINESLISYFDKIDGCKKCFLNSDISLSIKPFVPLITELKRLKENEIFKLYITSYGGSVDTGLKIIEAISQSKGIVVTIGSGIIASMGSAIWLYGNKLKLTEGTITMFHMSSHGDLGNSNLIKKRADAIISFVKTILNKALSMKLIDKKEYDLLVNENIDLFIPYTTMKKRLKELNNDSRISSVR